MTTYRKAWLFNAVWMLSLLVILTIGLFGSGNQSDETPLWIIVVFVASVIIYGGAGFLGNSYPKCPNCGEPVNMPRSDRLGVASYFIRPERPAKECGYCGLDLTVPYNPE